MCHSVRLSLVSSRRLMRRRARDASQLDGSEEFLGWVVAAYSFGQLIASPLFGLWCQHRPYMEPMIVSIAIGIAGNVMYCFADVPARGKNWWLLAARLVVGLSSGTSI